MGGNLLALIKDFLSDRYQYVSIDGKDSEKSRVTSGVPQGSVLGPTLFVYYINDMPGVVDCNVKVFADDTKAYQSVESEENRIKLQKNIDNLVDWSDEWLMSFNTDKCKMLHLGKNNPQHVYYMKNGENKNILEKTRAEKDLGVVVDAELTFEDHMTGVVKRANRMAGLVMSTISFNDKKVLIPLYKAMIRPILEYGNAVWNPFLRKHINMIDTIQRRFTKRISGFGDKTYEERLRLLGLPSLEFRRIRGNMIEVFKILNGIYDPCTTDTLLTLSADSKTRGHSLKLEKIFVNTRTYKNFFTNSVINHWNNLPADCVNASTVNSFKNKLDKVYSDKMFTTEL